MYIDNTSLQLQVFLCSLGLGFIFGLVYDFFRAFRILIIKNNKYIPAQDIAYFFICSIITFVFLLVINNGILRLNILIAFLSGFAIYYFTISRFIINLLIISFKKFRTIINAISQLITVPFHFMILLFGKIHLKAPEIFKNIKKSRKKAEKTLENQE